MEFLLRDAMPEDSAPMAALYLAARRALLPFAPLAHTDDEVHGWVASQLLPGGGCTVAVARGAVRGFVAASEWDGLGWIDQLYVAPADVGQGLGSRLLTHALRRLPRPVRLYTFQANVRARRFYEAHGFELLRAGDGNDNEERCPDWLMERRA